MKTENAKNKKTNFILISRDIHSYRGVTGCHTRSLTLLNARGRATARLHELDELMMLMKRSSSLRPALEKVWVRTRWWG